MWRNINIARVLPIWYVEVNPEGEIFYIYLYLQKIYAILTPCFVLYEKQRIEIQANFTNIAIKTVARSKDPFSQRQT